MGGPRNYRLALFDMDDVVYDYCRADRIAVLVAATGLDPDFIEQRIWFDGVETAADGGAYPTPELYLAAWAERLGYPLAEDDWVRARAAGMTLEPGTLAVIDRLAAAGLTVAVLTNNGPLVARHKDRLAPELAARVGDRFLVSSTFGTQKPDPAIYTAALARLGFAPGESFFVDDREDNCAGARRAGLAAHVFRTPGRLGEWLADLGIRGIADEFAGNPALAETASV
jgi:putative hydrolase of the HAD superfamily